MSLIIAILGYLLAAYFFTAVLKPALRFRPGYKRSWSWSRSGNTKGRYRQTRMGTLTCLGSGIFFAALSTCFVAPDSMMTTAASFGFIGGIIAVIGNIADTGGGSGWRKY